MARSVTIVVVAVVVALGAAACGDVQADHSAPEGFTNFSQPVPAFVNEPGTRAFASLADVTPADNPLPRPIAGIAGREPTAVHLRPASIDGRGEVELVYNERDVGPFRFEQFTEDAPPTGQPAACIGCDEDQSGRVTLTNGDRALVWVDGDRHVVNSITWWHGQVSYALVGPPRTLTRDVMIALANASITTGE